MKTTFLKSILVLTSVASFTSSCVNDDNLDVVVNPLPVVDFLVDSLICLNSNVGFINNSTLAF